MDKLDSSDIEGVNIEMDIVTEAETAVGVRLEGRDDGSRGEGTGGCSDGA